MSKDAEMEKIPLTKAEGCRQTVAHAETIDESTHIFVRVDGHDCDHQVLIYPLFSPRDSLIYDLCVTWGYVDGRLEEDGVGVPVLPGHMAVRPGRYVFIPGERTEDVVFRERRRSRRNAILALGLTGTFVLAAIVAVVWILLSSSSKKS
jgi:hypothetical protein